MIRLEHGSFRHREIICSRKLYLRIKNNIFQNFHLKESVEGAKLLSPTPNPPTSSPRQAGFHFRGNPLFYFLIGKTSRKNIQTSIVLNASKYWLSIFQNECFFTFLTYLECFEISDGHICLNWHFKYLFRSHFNGRVQVHAALVSMCALLNTRA